MLGLLAGSSAAALVPSCPSSAGCGRPASPLLPPGGANLARRASHTCLWVAKASAAHRRAPYPVAAEHTPDEDSPTFEGMQARARSFTQTFLLALAVLLTVRQFVVEPFYIPSTSMYPTLKTRDQIAVEKFSKLYGLPKRGDLIVFKPPAALDEARGFASSNSLIKRVVATEGDSVEVREGMLYLNDRAVYEPYVLEKPRYALPRLVVPSGFVFVLGDNRNVSVDSHVWGASAGPARRAHAPAQLGTGPRSPSSKLSATRSWRPPPPCSPLCSPQLRGLPPADCAPCRVPTDSERDRESLLRAVAH